MKKIPIIIIFGFSYIYLKKAKKDILDACSIKMNHKNDYIFDKITKDCDDRINFFGLELERLDRQKQDRKINLNPK